jgi:putative nucleotidyltransferase with HDIG domain
MNNYPDIKEAIYLWQESLSGILNHSKPNIQMEYIYHTTGVAESAYKIAQKCNLDPQKAYVAGLLHDYGKIQNEKQTGFAHFLYGYEKMTELGFGFIAKICLTHSFPYKDFSFDDYISYKKEDLIKTKNILSEIEYDDYDRLIQLCDIFYEGMNKVTYQRRIEGIKERYNLSDSQIKPIKEGAEMNKAYFDKLCSCDIYEILKI